MGLSTSKKTTTNDPWAPAQPYILNGLDQTQQTFDTNQPRLQQMSQTAQDAYDQIAPMALGTNNFAQTAQNTAQSIANGKYLGTNPGASAFSSLMQPANDPSMSALTSLAAGSKSPGSYDGIGTSNPALGSLYGMAQSSDPGQSSQFYADTLNGKYLNGNPYLDGIVQNANDASTKAVNSRFAAAGMGEGLSTPYASALGDAVSKNENSLRYGAYNDELNRMGTIAGQSDAMTNAGADRRLSASTNLGSLFNQTGQLQLGAQQAKDSAFNADRASQLGAATALGSQFTAGQQTQLNAGKAADDAYQAQQSQMMQALGLVPGLADAQYSGVAPALSMLNAAATAPYIGVSAFNGGINGLSNGYGTSTTKETGSVMDYLLQMQANAAKAAAAGA